MITHGSAFPIAKLALNNSVPPILMASLRMGIVLICLIPFWRFEIPKKKYLPSLVAFSISMGVLVYVFMNLSLHYSNIISPIIIGAQLAIPFGILASAVMIGENISFNKWILIFTAFLGIIMQPIAYGTWYHVMGRNPVHKVMPVMLLLPLTGLSTAIFLLGEEPTKQVFIGGTIILFGIGMILFSKPSNKKN